jgi:hypothetical protein
MTIMHDLQGPWSDIDPDGDDDVVYVEEVEDFCQNPELDPDYLDFVAGSTSRQEQNTTQQLLTTAQAAERWGINHRQARHYIRTRRIGEITPRGYVVPASVVARHNPLKTRKAGAPGKRVYVRGQWYENVATAARELGVTRQTIYNWRKERG